MSEKETRDIGNELAARNQLAGRNQNNATGNDIVFDPVTGELVLVRPGERKNPDATTVNQIAEDGFAQRK